MSLKVCIPMGSFLRVLSEAIVRESSSQQVGESRAGCGAATLSWITLQLFPPSRRAKRHGPEEPCLAQNKR